MRFPAQYALISSPHYLAPREKGRKKNNGKFCTGNYGESGGNWKLYNTPGGNRR